MHATTTTVKVPHVIARLFERECRAAGFATKSQCLRALMLAFVATMHALRGDTGGARTATDLLAAEVAAAAASNARIDLTAVAEAVARVAARAVAETAKDLAESLLEEYPELQLLRPSPLNYYAILVGDYEEVVG